MKSKSKNNKGFTLVELLVGVAVFLIIVLAVYKAYTSIFSVVYTSRAKIDAVDLANEQLEIIRNLPYSDVGISGGIPSGKLSHTQSVTRDSYQFDITLTVRNVDDPFDGTLGGTPNDLSPADHKTVEVEINCILCRNFSPISVTTTVSPKNLETASTNGALFVKVFDADGNPVEGANVHIENNSVTPHIVIDDTTNSSGLLQIVDAPPGVNVYEITVTKSGFSTDKTYASTVGNPNPVKPHATVVLQQVTQSSFVIDNLGSFAITSQTDTCSPVPAIDFQLRGDKLIGTSPNNYKYDQAKVTNGSGTLAINSLEWDSYNFTLTDSGYDLVGTNPLLPANLAPGSNQALQLIVAPKNPRTLLVIVKDSSTSLPLSGVDVTLSKTAFSQSKITGQGFLGQTDWSHGDGQATSTDLAQYFSSDGNIDKNTMVGDVILKKTFGLYESSGVLTSSSFDVGSPSNFQKIVWSPQSQPVETGSPNVRFQIATNNDGGTWNYKGPDGTATTYYTVLNQNIHSSNNGNRYLRYKLFLNTASTSYTPNISDVSFTFTSDCTPPGQVAFTGLASGTYNLHLTKSGYVDQDVSIPLNSSWQSQEVVMIPN
jgi:prepilin-type N-terminal cleavage/methylation domain-containing protein